MTLLMDKNKDKKTTAQGWEKYLFFLILSLSLKLLYFSLSHRIKDVTMLI